MMPETNIYFIGADKHLSGPINDYLTDAYSRKLILRHNSTEEIRPEKLDREALHIFIFTENIAGEPETLLHQNFPANIRKIVIGHNVSTGKHNKSGYCFKTPLRYGAVIDHIEKLISDWELSKEHPSVIKIGPYKFLPSESLLRREEDNSEIILTEKERDILLTLYQSGEQGVDRKTLLQKIWGFSEKIETHTLETHIYRLRQKIEPDPSFPVCILTSEEGYRAGK